MRSAVARKLRLFIDNVTVVIALSQFAGARLVKVGFDPNRIKVLPNMVAISSHKSPSGGLRHVLWPDEPRERP